MDVPVNMNATWRIVIATLAKYAYGHNEDAVLKIFDQIP